MSKSLVKQDDVAVLEHIRDFLVDVPDHVPDAMRCYMLTQAMSITYVLECLDSNHLVDDDLPFK